MALADVTRHSPSRCPSEIGPPAVIGDARQHFWVGNMAAPPGEAREARRRGTLTLTGMTSMNIESPDARYGFTREGSGIWVDGDFGAYPGEPAPPDDGLVRLWFFVQTWNSRMMFTAKTCGLEWA
jgi:hypothetical protein